MQWASLIEPVNRLNEGSYVCVELIHYIKNLFRTSSLILADENIDRNLPGVDFLVADFAAFAAVDGIIALLLSRKISPFGSSAFAPPNDKRPPFLLGVGGPGRLYSVPRRISLCVLSMLSSIPFGL